MAHDTLPSTTVAVLLLVQLRVWPGNPRKTVGDVSELAASIKEHGILEPLLVRPLAGVEGLTHEIVAGQRRYLAACAAGSDSAPCIVREMGDTEALEIGLVENGQRVDPSPLEDGAAMQVLIIEHGRTVEQIADKLGRDRRYVQRRLALVALCPTAKTWLAEGILPLKHAEMLAAVDAATQESALTRYKARDLPSAREFARALSFELMALDCAPFDTKDVKLTKAGACGLCPKNSAAQRDLFDGMGQDAHCLDRVCWDAKVEALWERTVKDAKKRRLIVLDEREIFAWGRVVRRDLPYVSAEELKGAEAPQTAVARDPYGLVVPLYDRPKRAVARDDYQGDEMDGGAFSGPPETDDDIEPETADEGESTSVAPRRPSRPERTRAAYVRLLEVLATPEGLRAGLRTALQAVVVEWGGTDLWRCMDVMGLDYHEDALPEADAARVPDADVLRVLVAMLVAHPLDGPPDEDTPDCERELRALIAGASSKPATGAEVAAELQRLGREHGITGEVADAMCREIGDPVSDASETATHRVLIVPDEGWSKHVKGLDGFSAEKTPGAGALSGGACRPLRLVYTSTGHAEVATLLARLDAAKVPYLDLGDATLSEVYGCTPASRSVREHWNEDHPTRPVTIGDGEPGWATASTSESTSEKVETSAETLTSVWISEREWDRLTEDAREQFVYPDVGVDELPWEGTHKAVTCKVTARTLGMLKELAGLYKVTLHEGEVPSKTKRAKKTVKS